MLRIKRTSIAFMAFLIVAALSFPAAPVDAAALTSLSDTMSTQTASTAADHDIQFTTPTGVSADDSTITVTFPAGFVLTSVTEDDVDVEDDTSDLTTAADCTGAEDAGVVISGQVITITICNGDGGAIAASSVINVKVGTNATGSGTGSNQITNATAATYTIDIGGTMSDSGALSVPVISDDTVAVSATVDPTISFSISDVSIGFGTLDSAAARWATGDLNGSGTDSAAAHTMAISTNATNGYAVTYNGSTLTSGADTITVASISNDANGTQGSEEFGMGFSTSGDATIAAAYDHNATPASRDWAFVADTTTTIVSEIVPTATETISAFYLANISGNTEAGSYSTSITFIATATF